MKNIKSASFLSLAAATLALSVSSVSAAKYVFVPGNDRAETKICIAAAENNLRQYKSLVGNMAVSRSKNSINRVVANKLTCNDQSVAGFAYQYGAEKTGAFISKFANGEVIVKREVADLDKKYGEDEVVYVVVE